MGQEEEQGRMSEELVGEEVPEYSMIDEEEGCSEEGFDEQEEEDWSKGTEIEREVEGIFERILPRKIGRYLLV